MAGTDDAPVLEHLGTYDLAALIPGEDNRLAGVMMDWQGRIWTTTVGTQLGPAMVGVLNPAKCSYEDPVINWYDELPRTEVIQEHVRGHKGRREDRGRLRRHICEAVPVRRRDR